MTTEAASTKHPPPCSPPWFDPIPIAMPSQSRTCQLFVIAFSTTVAAAAAQAADADVDSYTPPNVAVSFRPSVAIVIGVFSLMFSLTFLLLIYAKFCHSTATASSSPSPDSDLFSSATAAGASHGRFLFPQNRLSGIDKSVIESLPFFRFSSLRGVRAGLECAVCLSKFDDAELLRLLPKCRHAFHVPCVDRWLEAHSSCPLCRCRVKAEDAALLKFSASARLLFAAASDRDLELFVERERDDGGGSARFSFGGSFRKIEKASAKGDMEQDLPILEDGERFLHKFKHKIIVSDVVFKSRWSDVNSSDLISLNSELLSANWSAEPNPNGVARTGGGGIEGGKATLDEKVLKIKEEMEKKRQVEMKVSELNKTNPIGLSGISSNKTSATSRSLISSGNRSMSEITNRSRFREVNESSTEDEKLARVWLPIAKRTVQWFAGRERRPPNPEASGLDGESATGV